MPPCIIHAKTLKILKAALIFSIQNHMKIHKINLLAEPEYWVSMLLILIIGVLVFSFGINFPMPWDDESYFILQAISFASCNNLYSSELSPDRHIMWMQPGYMVMLGLFFKIFDFSLLNARIFSLIFYCLATLIFLKTIKGGKEWLSQYLVFCFVAILPSSLAIANIARMEAIILFCGGLSLVSLIHRKFLLTTALILIGGLVHFNGLYFGIPLVLALIYHKNNLIEELRATASYEKIALALSVIFVLAYLVYVYINLEAFMIDMSYQFSRKLGRPAFYLNLNSIIMLLASIGTVFYMYVKRDDKGFMFSLFGMSMILIYVNGQEMWYQVFRNYGLGLLLISVLPLIFNRKLRMIVVILGLICLLVISGLGLSGLRPAISQEPYISEEFKAALEDKLLHFKTNNGGSISVSFNVSGVDMLFYEFFRKNDIKLIHRMPFELVSPSPVDVCIHITRAQDPIWLKKLEINQYPIPELCRRASIISGSNQELLIIPSSGYIPY